MPKNSPSTTATERSASGRQRKRSSPHPTQPDSNAAEPVSTSNPLSPDLLEKMDAYWRAANYLSVGQIYLQDNPLLEVPLERQHIKTRLLGHWGTTSGLNFIYVHLNRLIKHNDLNMILRHRAWTWRTGPRGAHLS